MSFFSSVSKSCRRRRRWTKKCDPKDLRPLLYGLSSCQQIYQETKDILFCTYVVAKPDWCLRDTAGVSSFFARTISFCQAMEHYAPSSRFGVEASSGRFGRESTVFTPKHVKFFIDELERQTQRAARITLEVQTLRDDEAMQRRILFDADLYPCPVWKSAKWRCSGKCSPESPAICAGFWELEKSTFHARGSVGEYVFLYSWCGPHGQAGLRSSSLRVAGSLAQLDWNALEKGIDAVHTNSVQN